MLVSFVMKHESMALSWWGLKEAVDSYVVSSLALLQINHKSV